ncbi:MAG: hypothetical protein BGO70_02085 [Bacteroidetes bacterium 43-93]|nr:MAG: hypothetical protein BGO70_02085 [Bacteroidetes bacterium 43-93]
MGIEVVVDKTYLKYDGHIKSFMIHFLDADIILIILTPKYKIEPDKLISCAGYEYNIINDELYKVIQTNEKFMPIIRSDDIESSVS